MGLSLLEISELATYNVHNFLPTQMKITPTQMIFSPILVDKKIPTTDNILANAYENITNTDDIFTNSDKNAAKY